MTKRLKRGSAERIRDLMAVLNKEPTGFTNVLYGANLNFYTTCDALEGLCVGGFASYVLRGSRKKYFLTPKGKDFYRLLDSCLCVVEACLE